jgi:hypothetical protein
MSTEDSAQILSVPQSTNGVEDAEYEDYVSQRNATIEREMAAAATYDKFLVTLAGGALGLSMTFLSDIVGKDAKAVLPLLFWPWVLLGLSLACSLMGHLFSQYSFRAFVKALDSAMQARIDSKETAKEVKVATWHINVMNWLALACLFSGLIWMADSLRRVVDL